VAEEGFTLYDKFYPVPKAYAPRHMRLVKHITGESFKAWAEAMDTLEGFTDPLNQAAWMAVAWWQQNPRATQYQAEEFGDTLELERVELVGFDEEEADAAPLPEEGAQPSNV